MFGSYSDEKPWLHKSKGDEESGNMFLHIALVPKLRAAASEKERAVLQNAVASTVRKIDELTYQLYDLTPEEITLVEAEK